MRTDLRLNYGELEAIQERIEDYRDALEEMEDALEDLKDVLSEQESDAVDRLKEKLSDVTINIGDKKETLRQLGSILGNYISDMRGLVKEGSEGGQTRVDIWDIGFNLSQIETEVRTAFMPMSSTVTGVWHFTLTTDEEEEQKKKKRERNYKRLENFRSGSIMGLKNRVNSRVEELKNIQNTYLKPFEQMDDDYRSKLSGIYHSRTSEKDKWDNFWESFGSIAGAFVKAFVIAAVTAFIVTVAPVWAVVAIVVVLGTGIAVMANMPEETVPECLSGVKEFADGVANEAVKVLKEGPVVLVEDIGQGFMDTIQTPEGIASVAGGTLGSLAGGFAGNKVKLAMQKDDILIDSYKNLRKNKEIPGQAHHLNQDAAFRDVIPSNEGMAVKLEGNIRTDINSPHYKAHESLEGFWNNYRKGGAAYGKTPTLTEYNSALYDSLRQAGLSNKQATQAVNQAIKQQLEYNLTGGSLIPRIPGKINLPKLK